MGSCATGSINYPQTPSPSQFNAAVRMQGNSWSGFTTLDGSLRNKYGISSVDENTETPGSTGGEASGSWTITLNNLTSDENYKFQAAAEDIDGYKYGTQKSTKTTAIIAVISANPAASAVTTSTATITVSSYTPGVLRSTCSAQLQYKRTVDPGWSNAGSAQDTGGYSAVSITANVTGLTASTAYDMRLVITRGTVNDTSLTGTTTSFTTAAGVPTTTTNAATGVSHSVATLNQTAVINEGTTVTAYWKYGIQNPPTDTTTASQAISSNGTYSVATGALVASTLYYAQAFLAFATPAGSPASGSVINFTTSSNPAAEAADEDHLTIQEYDAVYGVQKAFVFLAAAPAATSSNIFLSAASPWAAAECNITIDGGAVTTCTNAPTRIGSSAFFTITLTAGELTGENIWVHMADSGAAARDVALHIRTSIEAGKMVLNALQMTNTTALLATGIGSGHGISAVAGATGKDISGVLGSHILHRGTASAGGASTITLQSSTASATNDFYNGAIVMVLTGTGAAQARFIIDYDGGTKVATVHKAWSANPANNDTYAIIPAEDPWGQTVVELASIPTAASSFADKLQFVWQRFAYKRKQSATVHTMYKADSSTALGTAAVADDGTDQSFAKVV